MSSLAAVPQPRVGKATEPRMCNQRTEPETSCQKVGCSQDETKIKASFCRPDPPEGLLIGENYRSIENGGPECVGPESTCYPNLIC